MPAVSTSPVPRTIAARLRASPASLAAVLGALATLSAVLTAGELYLRVAPPGDLAPYLPESGAQGPFCADDELGVQYQSLDALKADNPGVLDPFVPLFGNSAAPPVWAFFGNSFVQAPGMLADTTRRYVPQRITLNLGKNEPVPVRFAQAALLLDSGLKPDRVFLTFIPLDVYTFAVHGLNQYRATAGGALAYAPRVPAAGGALVRNSRLALKGWTRTTLHQNRPFVAPASLYTHVDDAVRADTRALLDRFAARAARHRVPVTVVLLPSYEQVLRGAGFAVQDAVAADARAAGLDVLDVRDTFLARPDKPTLFIPDKHFSATGNRLLLAALLEHVRALDPRAGDLPTPAEVRP